MTSSSPPPDADVRLLRALVDAVPDMLLLGRYNETTAEITIVATNATARSVTGLTEQELVGVTPRSLLAPGAIAPDLAMRQMLAARARKLGVVEYPGEVRLRVPASGPRIRIRLVWPDPDDTLVLVQVEILRD